MKMSEEEASHPFPPHPKWSRFADWIHSVCVVTFDLELGQAMEMIHPTHASLSEQEKTNICYLAFPDSNSGCMGDTQFHIRLRACPGDDDPDAVMLSPVHRQFNKDCICVQKADVSHLWGFVYFRQHKDERIPRGYFQKSFIILTKLPFFNLYYELLSVIAPKYFSEGVTVLHSVCEQICTWPALAAGKSLDLHILGTVYQTAIPHSNTKSRNSTSTNKNTEILSAPDAQSADEIGPKLPPHVLPTVHDIDTFYSLSGFLSHIYTLWELVMCAEPIIVMGTSPTDCSHMVQSLVSMIDPLAYCGEYRPYFTIHDSEFKEFTQDLYRTGRSQPQSIMIGVTNPFFSKLLQSWPHIVKLEDSQNNGQMNESAKKRLTATCTPGMYTKYRPFLLKDKAFIKKLALGVKTRRPEQIQSVLIRRNLLQLTQSFMIPLERYMASLLPLQRDISPFKSAPNPNEFREDDFLATLKFSGPQLTSTLKGNWKGLYKRFFKSPNFKGWYQARHRELQQKLQAVQLKALSDADLNQWAKGKQEVEIIDMIMKLQNQLKLADENNSVEYSETGSQNGNDDSGEVETSESSYQAELNTRRQLQRQLDRMKQSLPDDLKLILADK